MLEPGRWVYYFADTTQRTVFWVDKIKISDVVGDTYRPVQSGAHLGSISPLLSCITTHARTRFVTREPVLVYVFGFTPVLVSN